MPDADRCGVLRDHVRFAGVHLDQHHVAVRLGARGGDT
jgi:hypothetical protein